MSKKQKKVEKMDAGELQERAVEAAASYYSRFGYEVLDRNWECPAGAIGLVVRDPIGGLTFVEVVSSAGVERGFKEECRCAAARARLEKIAGYYLIQHDEVDIPIGFDVLSLLVVTHDRALVKHWRGAFREGECSGCCGYF